MERDAGTAGEARRAGQHRAEPPVVPVRAVDADHVEVEGHDLARVVPAAAREMFDVAAWFGVDVEIISYGHTLVQAADLQIALAFGRTTHFEQPVPPEPFEYGVTSTLRTGSDGLVHAPDASGLGIDEELHAGWAVGR